MAKPRIPLGRLQAAFATVVALLTAVSVYTLISVLQTNERMDRLVTVSLERGRIVGSLRTDMALLVKHVDDHIDAVSDKDRESADAVILNLQEDIASLLSQLEKLSADDRPSTSQTAFPFWQRLTQISNELVGVVETAVKFSSRREAERARRLQERKVKPLYIELEDFAVRLDAANQEQATLLLRELERIRLTSSLIRAGLIAVAVIASILVAWQVTRLLRRQADIISDQLFELDRRNAELDAFASRVAHDLISPLSPLKGYLTLARRQSSQDSQRELLLQSESLVQRLSELVEALLRFCRAGQTSERAVGSLSDATTTILLEAAQVAQQAKVELVRDIEAQVTVACSTQLLQSIAQNLVSNAIKYTAGRPNARVRVQVGTEEQRGILSVDDNGLGIQKSAQSELFRPFFRSPESKVFPGFGLGLATAKRLVEAHGGQLQLHSESNMGTRVVVELPLAQPAAKSLSQTSLSD